jgi:hypothetical protein
MSVDLMRSAGFDRSFEARLRLAPQDEGRETVRRASAPFTLPCQGEGRRPQVDGVGFLMPRVTTPPPHPERAFARSTLPLQGRVKPDGGHHDHH